MEADGSHLRLQLHSAPLGPGPRFPFDDFEVLLTEFATFEMERGEYEKGPENFGAAVLVLQTPSSGLEDRVASLRYLYRYVMDPVNKQHINSRVRKNINELVLSTVLSIAMSEDRISDLRRRQLIRAECFLILGKLLESNTLFGNVKEKLDEIEANNTALLLSQQAEADRDNDDLTVDADGEDYSRGATGAVRQSVSAGEARAHNEPMPSSRPGPGPHTPERRRGAPGVQLRNPMHSGKRSALPGGSHRAAAKGSPEVKHSSPPDSPDGSVDKTTLDHALTFMLPPVPDGWEDPDSPSTVVSAHSEETFDASETKGQHVADSDGHSPKPRPRMGPPGGWVREEKVGPSVSPLQSAGKSSHTKQVGIMSQSLDRLSSDLAYSSSGAAAKSLSLIAPVLNKQPRKILQDKKFLPRPSGFLGGDFELDNFALGVDPTNWFEQDKRLGYQKPRMFFPIPGVAPNLERSLLPDKRQLHASELTVDAVVQEFLQMRAMLSYVGDQILIPYALKSRKITKTEEGLKALAVEGHFGSKTAKPLRRLAGVLGDGLYEEAVKQAMSVWTPLVGANLPRWAQPGQSDSVISRRVQGQTDATQYQASLKLGDKYGDTPMERPPWEPSPTKSIQTGLNVVPRASDVPEGQEAEQSVLLTKKILRSLVRREGKDRQRTHMTMQKTMDLLARNDYVSREAVQERQASLLGSLEAEEKTIQHELNAIRQLSLETVKAQYAMLPKRFLLLIEGKNANPRELIIKLTETFCRVRSRNWMVLAFGTWKAHYILAESARRAPVYARTAACYLMKEWATNRKLKQMKKQLRTWALNVARCIFADRNRCVLPIQTLYRRYRDRCTLLRMHVQGAYDGPLSDIELGPERDLLFKIPAIIRSTRRDIWRGVVRIQTNYRRWWVYRHTLKRRRQVILLQSVIRMFPVRERFKRLKHHTIRMQAYARRMIARRKWCYMKIQAVIIQKYVRRYLRILWKLRLFNKAWRKTEKRMAAAILIQCRWREYKARKRVFNIIRTRKMRDWAALVLQRVWFKRKRAFHTFALMCCLRAAEYEEGAFDKFVVAKRRFFSARRVQRIYAMRFFRRNVAAAVKIQCKYRGYHGYNLMEKMRREKWACRRLCHWARGALKRTMKRVRQIQRCWWNYKKGNLMKHLERRYRLSDLQGDKLRKDKRFTAALRIQALIHGIFARRWVRRTRAALKIQRPARLFIARRNWKRQSRARNRGAIMKYVDKIVSAQIKARTKDILQMHSLGMIKPQAVARGFIVRTQFYRATVAAHEFAKAVIRIQRFWRSSGAMAQAVAEVMARKRATTNPFRECGSLHRLLLTYFRMAEKLYSTRDPRAGMKVSTLLYRLGLSYLEPMFPARQFSSIDDMRELDLPTMEEMYSEWQAYEEKKRSTAGERDKRRRPPAPVDHFNFIILVVKPSLVPRSPKDIATVQLAQHYAENTISPAAAALDIQKRFIKKFGQSQSTRATNLGEKVKLSWYGYNNHKALGTLMTPGMATRALEDTFEGSNVWSSVQTMMERVDDAKQLKQELDWDKKRVAECADLSQLAVEQARAMLIAGHDFDEEAIASDPLLRILTKAYDRVVAYKRKFNYTRDKMLTDRSVHPTDPAQDGRNGVHFTWALPEKRHDEVLSGPDSIDLPYLGSAAQFDIEANLSIVKVYQEAFNSLYTSSSGVQGLKTKWFIYTVRKAIRDARTKRFLERTTEAYIHDRHADHVTEGWLKFKRADAVARKLKAILQDMEESKRLVQEFLQYIVQYGWEEKLDDQGYAYFVDTLDRGLDATYDMPRYNAKQWKSVSMIQRKARIFLERLKEHRRVKEEAKAREMALIEERWMEEVRKGKKGVRLEFSERSNKVKTHLLGRIAKVSAEEDVVMKEGKRVAALQVWRKENPGQKPPENMLPPAAPTILEESSAADSKASGKFVDATLFAEGSEKTISKDRKEEVDMTELERAIPWRLRFVEDPKLSSGMWVLLRTELPKAQKNSSDKPDTVGSDKGEKSARTGLGTSRKKTPLSSRKKGKNEPAAIEPFDTSKNPYVVKSGEFMYESVVIFNLRKVQRPREAELPPTTGGATPAPPAPVAPEFDLVCDTKNFRGTRNIGVNTNRIFVMNLEVGIKVECRYRQTVHFYRGKVSSIYENHLLSVVYGVLYDDGEVERNVSRDMIRPSPDGLRVWFDDRNAQIKDAILYLARKRHFASIKRVREESMLNKAFCTFQTYVKSQQPAEGNLDSQAASSPTKAQSKKKEKDKKAKDEDADLSREEQKQKAAAEASAAAASEEKRIAARAAKHASLLDAIFEDEASGEFFQKAEEAQTARIVITKLCYRYGWVEKKAEDGSLDITFKNFITGATQAMANPPIYRPEHDFSARKLQSNWKIRRSRKYFKRLLASEPLEDIIKNAVKRYQKFAWIGFADEGITPMMMLRRYGFFVLADCIEEKFKYKKDQLAALTIQGVVSTPPDLFERLGVVGVDKIKALKDFQAWFNKTPPFLRERSAQLINYYNGIDDRRPLQEVLAAGETYLTERFLKVFPQSAARTQKATREVATTSLYPLTTSMVDWYLKKYGDKADSARENIHELISKKTTHQWQEEKEAYQILWGATLRLKSLLGGFKLKQIHGAIAEAEEAAAEALSSITGISPAAIKAAEKAKRNRERAPARAAEKPSEVDGAKNAVKKGPKKDAAGELKKKARDDCSGPEARAALILRVKVLQYMQRVLHAVAVLQRVLRGFSKKSSVWKVILKRRHALSLMQRSMRGCMDRAIAIDLRQQQKSPWEQLWDENRELVYYYNRSTGKSTYLEPGDAYRPLVRDRRSQALVQAWPFLDADRENSSKVDFGLPPGLAAFAPSLAMCCVCQSRKCVRLCIDCGSSLANSSSKTKVPDKMPYCFPCFTVSHATDETENHRFTEANEGASKDASGLVCCMCTTEPATRKCQGILDDRQIDDLCEVLQRSVSKLWPEILAKANVGGERKLAMLLEDIMGSASESMSAIMSPSQLQQVRMMLERTRTECDEVYCDNCYKEVHAGGKRSLHKWIGFQANAPVCSVCIRSPGEVVCKECDNSAYCNSCFRVFHAMGRKRKHKNSPLQEELAYGQTYCLLCTRRAGTVLCQNMLAKGEDGRCSKRHCESCFECTHKPSCDVIAKDFADKEITFLMKRGQAPPDPNLGEEGKVCCLCGEVADQKCVVCNDLYCSRTWMGNPGCFVKCHAKGEKAKHKTVTLASLQPKAPPPGGFGAWAPSRKKKPT